MKRHRPEAVLELVLSYLAMVYLQHRKFALAAGAWTPTDFHDYLRKNHGELVSNLDRFIGVQRIEFTDSHHRGKNDLAHMAYTLFCYRYISLDWLGRRPRYGYGRPSLTDGQPPNLGAPASR